MQPVKNKTVFLLPRIINILYVCFIGMFSLDSFDGKHSFSEMLLGFLIHNIPTFILLIILIVSWKKALLGAVLFLLASISMFLFIKIRYFSYFLLLIAPLLLLSILFLIDWYINKTTNKRSL